MKMKTIINNTNVETLIKGASIFTTGGGITVSEQLNSLKDLKLNVEIKSLDEFDVNDFLCTVGELGPTDAPPMDKIKVAKAMLLKLEKIAGKKIAGLYPPEIGQESVVLESAHILGLPVADFDPSGFRAVPYFDINIFNIKKIDFGLTPIVIATDENQILAITSEYSYKKVEKKLRKMSLLSKSGIIFLIGQTVNVKQLLKNNINRPSYTKALSFGEIKRPSVLLRKLNPKMVIKGKVVKKAEFEQKGFLGEKITIKDTSWNIYTLIILNEALFLLDSSNKIIGSIPDRILLIDENNIMGISSAFLKKNTIVTIAIIDPEPEWKNKRAEKILGKARFRKLLL